MLFDLAVLLYNGFMEKICSQCKEPYKKPYTMSLKKWSTSRFCSHRCHSDSLKGIGFFTGQKHSAKTKSIIKKKRMKQKNVSIVGLEVGRVKVWTPAMREKLRQVAVKRGLGRGRGKDAPNWRGGRTRIVRIYRRCPAYATWRLEVFKRDGFRCQNCKTNKYLEADHIKPVAEIFIENKIKTSAQMYRCLILWDISNGRTLCKGCHRG